MPSSGCDSASRGKWLPTFRSNVVPVTSRVQGLCYAACKRVDPVTGDTASHITKPEHGGLKQVTAAFHQILSYEMILIVFLRSATQLASEAWKVSLKGQRNKNKKGRNLKVRDAFHFTRNNSPAGLHNTVPILRSVVSGYQMIYPFNAGCKFLFTAPRFLNEQCFL